MLRAGLILVILLGVGALGISQFKVAPKIATLETDLGAAEAGRYEAEQAQSRAEVALNEAEEAVETLRGDLTTSEDNLKQARNDGAQQRARADDLQDKLISASEQRNEARRTLAQWEALGVSIQSVQTMKDQILLAREEIEAITGEKAVLIRQLDQVQYELSRFVGNSHKVPMPEDLKGSVLAVDPQWGFVVLNVGEKDGAREHGELLVSREGKLVGKVQITSVEGERSIANVVPGWQQAEIQVGDAVLY